MDELLRQAAENMGMPPALTERSARARAEKEGTTVEAVLAEWAGAEPPESAPAGAPTSTPGDAEALDTANEGPDSPPAATAAPDPQPSESSAPTEVSTEYLVALAADAKRMPEKLVRSSAEARARNAGADLDEVLAAWAGVDLADLHARAEAGEPLPEADPESPATPEPAATAEPPAAEPAAAPAEAPPAATPAAAPAAAAAAALSADELLEQAAAAKGMPASIAKRSAEARAKKEGTSLEAVLAEWAGVDPSAATAGAPATESEAPAAEAPAAAPAAAAAAALSADELLEQAAAAKGMPASIAKRSAEARAKKEGTSLEAVLAEWAGVDPATVGSAPAAAPASEAPAASPAPAAPPAAPEAATDDVEVIEPPSEPDASFDEDEVVPTPARGGYPAWLAAAFVIIPLLAVTYILVSPNGPDCGTAGQLDIDPVTGLAVNCDGSEYGGSTVDFFAQGAGIYSQCAACHGANGEGGGNFPAFAGGAVLTTFPAGQCSDHVEWVTLGTANFPEPTYGATDKPVGGSGAVMPGYEGVLTPEQIASVSLYERVQFGGQPLEEALSDCGLVESEDDGTEDMTEASGG